jgi:hypothetical protein
MARDHHVVLKIRPIGGLEHSLVELYLVRRGGRADMVGACTVERYERVTDLLVASVENLVDALAVVEAVHPLADQKPLDY